MTRGMETRLAKLERGRPGGDLSRLTDATLEARIERLSLACGYAAEWTATKAAATGAALGVMLAKVKGDIHART